MQQLRGGMWLVAFLDARFGGLQPAGEFLGMEAAPSYVLQCADAIRLEGRGASRQLDGLFIAADRIAILGRIRQCRAQVAPNKAFGITVIKLSCEVERLLVALDRRGNVAAIRVEDAQVVKGLA